MKPMEIEIDSNINSTHSSSSINDNVPINKHIANKTPLNSESMLKELIEKYSLEKVVKSVIISVTSKRKREKEISELDSRINQIPMASNEEKEKEKFIEINNSNNKEKEKNDNSINKIANSNEKIIDVIQITDDDSKNSGKLNNNNNNNTNIDNLIVDINDNYLGNDDNKVENEEQINLKDKKLNSSNYLEINSNNDHSKKKSIVSQPNKVYDISQISYHCSIIEGIYYKYIKEYIKEKEIIFICINPKCRAWGIYDIEDKSFTLQKAHFNGKSIFCCKKYMTSQDERNKNYMIKNKKVEMLMYKDENDEI